MGGQEEIAVLMRMNDSLSLLLPQYLGLSDSLPKLLDVALHQTSCLSQ